MSTGATVSATRLLIAHNREVGISVNEAGARVMLTDAVIRDTMPAASMVSGGRSVNIQFEAAFEATRLLISGDTAFGAFVGASGTLSLTDCAIQHLAPEASPDEAGRAVSVQSASRFDAVRLLVADHRELGIAAMEEGAVVDLTDVVVRDTRGRVSDQRLGRGIQGQEYARIEGSRVHRVSAR